MGLIERVKANRQANWEAKVWENWLERNYDEEQEVADQLMADQLCVQMRRSCELLLENEGMRWHWATDGSLFCKSVIGTLIWLPTALVRGIPIYQVMDGRQVISQIGGDSQGIKVKVRSYDYDPTRADKLTVQAQDLDTERLVLRKTHGEIFGRRRRQIDLLGYWWPIRRANLEDATSWKEEIVDTICSRL